MLQLRCSTLSRCHLSINVSIYPSCTLLTCLLSGCEGSAAAASRLSSMMPDSLPVPLGRGVPADQHCHWNPPTAHWNPPLESPTGTAHLCHWSPPLELPTGTPHWNKFVPFVHFQVFERVSGSMSSLCRSALSQHPDMLFCAHAREEEIGYWIGGRGRECLKARVGVVFDRMSPCSTANPFRNVHSMRI